MTILLLTLLVIALSITAVGWLLSSSKVQAPNRREISYAARDATTQRRRMISYTPPRDTRMNRQREGWRDSLEVGRSPWTLMIASMSIGNIFRARQGKRMPWLGILLILLALFGFSILTLRTVVLNPGLTFDGSLFNSTAPAGNVASSPFSGVAGASNALLRVSQLDAAQYTSPQDYNTWALSACSAASMTEVINAYGHHYHIADILKVEAGLGEISPDQGLLESKGIDRTVEHFGFKAIWLTGDSLDKVIDVANQGRPIIVDFPPDRWTGGHLLVVRGGNSKHVYLADSSQLNMQVMTHTKFMQYWAGQAVAVIPQ